MSLTARCDCVVFSLLSPPKHEPHIVFGTDTIHSRFVLAVTSTIIVQQGCVPCRSYLTQSVRSLYGDVIDTCDINV